MQQRQHFALMLLLQVILAVMPTVDIQLAKQIKSFHTHLLRAQAAQERSHLMTEIERLQSQLEALLAERDTLHEAHAAAGKVMAAVGAAELAELAQHGLLQRAEIAPWPAWPMKPPKAL